MEDPALRAYRRAITGFVLVGALIAAIVGGVLLWRGHVFEALLALVAVGFFVLLAHGYRQDEEERKNPR
ncbi:MAG TPA: hypothetical protein VFY93_13415 [Planctomycetota bacterium]|nr:hypothetical protein [Planctomycetota bacterium]